MNSTSRRKGSILVADDETSLRLLLGKELSRRGYSVDTAENGHEALHAIREGTYNVVLLDIVMPRLNGITILKKIKEEDLGGEVIVLTGKATVENAIECMKLGAFEYVRKPYNLSELVLHIERAIAHQHSALDHRMLKEELKKTGYSARLTGESECMRELRRVIRRIAGSQSTVLVRGESGTGKEIVARSIHEQSGSGASPFVAVNCASFSEHLLESELFGYERGAFTDAKSQKRGLAEIADTGTLFLDEVSEIPLGLQARLLRFLETGEIRRVGGTRDIRLDVRIIGATNAPLEDTVGNGSFRRDLFYRLNVLSVRVPPLREHPDDIRPLVEYFVRMLGYQKSFDQSALDILRGYGWPGNIRELKNVVERSCILCTQPSISEKDISFLSTTQATPPETESNSDAGKLDESPVMSLKEMERRHIIAMLRKAGGHKGNAARMLEINPKTLYHKIKAYGIVSEYR